jgi:hypothetical protein
MISTLAAVMLRKQSNFKFRTDVLNFQEKYISTDKPYTMQVISLLQGLFQLWKEAIIYCRVFMELTNADEILH